jgi:hypothetical protein
LPAAASAATADLTVTAHSHDPASPAIGDDINYYFTVHNNGPDAATNITLSVAAFNGQVYQGSASPYPFTDDGTGFYTGTIGSIAAGEDVSFRISFYVTQGGSIYAFLSVDCANDPDHNNDSAEEDVVVQDGPTADLEMTMVTVTPNPSQVPLHAGDTFTFVFKATKAGPITLTGSAGGAYSGTYDPNGTNDNFDVTTTAAAAPTPPSHGGLSETSFTVNGSRDATSNVADTVLRFAAAQLETPADLTVRVQYTAVPGDHDAIWQDLNNGDGGLMTYDPVSQQFLLSSLNYPTSKTVAFRAVASASATRTGSRMW